VTGEERQSFAPSRLRVRLAITPTHPQHTANRSTRSLFQDGIVLLRKVGTRIPPPNPPVSLLTRVRKEVSTSAKSTTNCRNSAPCHLILEIFGTCRDGHSGLTRECAKFGIIPCNAPSRPSRLRVRRWYSLVPLTRRREDAKRDGRSLH
jgi:hypothetical protein